MTTTQNLAGVILTKLNSEIPQSKNLGLRLVDISEEQTHAMLPLATNTNHLGTLFGGSLFSAGALTCYSTLLGILARANLHTNNIVVIEGHIEYLKPGTGDCEVVVDVDTMAANEFVKSLRDQKRGKIAFTAEARLDGQAIAHIKARYLVRL